MSPSHMPVCRCYTDTCSRNILFHKKCCSLNLKRFPKYRLQLFYELGCVSLIDLERFISFFTAYFSQDECLRSALADFQQDCALALTLLPCLALCSVYGGEVVHSLKGFYLPTLRETHSAFPPVLINKLIT